MSDVARLKDYIRHKGWCQSLAPPAVYHDDPNQRGPRACDCGLDDLLLALVSPEASKEKELNLKWAAASEFIRDIYEAIGRPQPAPEATVNLNLLAFDVLGTVEELKARCEALEAELATWKRLAAAPFKED